jgi:hypothetical protein
MQRSAAKPSRESGDLVYNNPPAGHAHVLGIQGAAVQPEKVQQQHAQTGVQLLQVTDKRC